MLLLKFGKRRLTSRNFALTTGVAEPERDTEKQLDRKTWIGKRYREWISRKLTATVDGGFSNIQVSITSIVQGKLALDTDPFNKVNCDQSNEFLIL
jgi:hypothetical protein